MPQAVIGAYVATAFTVAKLAATSFLFNVGIRIAGVALLSTVTSKLFGPKVPEPLGLQPRDVMTRSAIQYRQIVYGQAAVSGPIIYNNIEGLKNQNLWYVIALAEGESEDLVEVRFDDRVVPKADIAWTAGTGGSDGTGTGNVSTSDFVGENSTVGLRIFYYLGDADQPVCGDLNTEFADIDTTHRARGVTHIVCRLRYDEDTEEVWESGPPQNIRVVLKGRKIYDPRLDSTNGGTGTHRYATPSTWEYSDNPALCVADYLISIMDVDPATRIDWPSIADAADDCDVSVTVPSGTETRFTCNGALSLGSTHKDNLDALVGSCDGKLSYTQGQWRLRASVWEASSVTITEDDLAGPVEVRGSAPKSERFNLIRGVFIDPARDYQAAEFPHVESATYQARDNGEVIPYDLQLPMTNSRTMAERIAYRVLEQGDNQTTVTLTTNLMGAQVRVGDVFTADLPTYGWTDGENLHPYSEDFSNAQWQNQNSTTNSTPRADPFGGTEAYLVTGDGTAGAQSIFDAVTLSGTGVYTLSAYTKKRDYDWVALNILGSVNGQARAYFNITDGIIGSTSETDFVVLASGMEKVGNGWYRCWLKADLDETSVSSYLRAAADDDDFNLPATIDGNYWFGAQLESGDLSIYKRTDGSAATTSAKTFRCIDWSRNPEGTFRVVGREDDSGDYNDPLSGEYASETTGAITLPSDLVPAPENLAAVSKPGGVELQWDDAPSRLYDQVEIWVSDDTGSSGFDDALLVATSGKSPYFFPLTYQFEERAFWVRASRNDGKKSNYEPVSTGAGVSGSPIETGTELVTEGDFTGTGFGVSNPWIPPINSGALQLTYDTTNDRITFDYGPSSSVDSDGCNSNKTNYGITEVSGNVVVVIDFDTGTFPTDGDFILRLSFEAQSGPFLQNADRDLLPGRNFYVFEYEHSSNDDSLDWGINVGFARVGTTGGSVTATGYLYSVSVKSADGVFRGISAESKAGLVPTLSAAASGKVLTDRGTFENVAAQTYVKDGDQTISSATFTDDTEISGIPLEADKWYQFELVALTGLTSRSIAFQFVTSQTEQDNGYVYSNYYHDASNNGEGIRPDIGSFETVPISGSGTGGDTHIRATGFFPVKCHDWGHTCTTMGLRFRHGKCHGLCGNQSQNLET